jgi:hypothetical protein
VGKEISYCQICGDRLGVGEALETQVYVHDGRRYCSACRPREAIAKIPIPDRRKSSTKVRAQPPAPRVKESTRIRKPSGLWRAIAAGPALALALGIAIAAGSRPSDPPSGPRPSPAAQAAAPEATPAPKAEGGPGVEDLLARIRELRQSDLMYERRDQVRRLLREAARKAGPRLEEVDLLSADYDRTFEEAAARLADFTRSEAARMAAKQKFGEAIERLDGYPAAFQASKAADSIRLLRDDYVRRRSPSGRVPPTGDASPRQVL